MNEERRAGADAKGDAPGARARLGWRTWIGGVGLAAVAVAAGIGVASWRSADSPCAGAEARLDGVWDDARRAAVERALLDTGATYASTTYIEVQFGLDAHTEAWVRMVTDACEAARVRGDETSEDLALRTECTDRDLRQVAARVEVLLDADEIVVERAVDLVAGLRPLTRCADLPLLRASARPSVEPSRAEAVATAEPRLALAHVLADVDRSEQALAMLDALPAAALEHPPLQVRGAALRGRILVDLGRHAEAEQVLRAALPIAERTGDRLAHARLLGGLTHVVGLFRMDEAEALRFGRQGVAIAQDAGDEPLQALTLNDVGGVFDTHARYDEAVDAYARTLAIQERYFPPGAPVLSTTLGNLALSLRHRGDLDQALEVRQRLLAIQRKSYGDAHPAIARSLSAIGNLLHMRGEYEASAKHHEKSLAMNLRVYGPDHLATGHSMSNLATSQTSMGLHAEAEANMRRSLELLERAVEPDDIQVIDTLNNLAITVEEQGRYEESLVLHRRTFEALERKMGPDHPRTAATLNNVAGALIALRRPAEALPMLERSIAVIRGAAGPEHPHVAMVEVSLGDALLGVGRSEEAEDHLRHALALIEKTFGPEHLYCSDALVALGRAIHANGDPQGEARALLERGFAIRDAGAVTALKHADAEFILAKVLASDPTQRSRARSLARRARRGYARSGPSHAVAVEEIDAWLEAHPDGGVDVGGAP